MRNMPCVITLGWKRSHSPNSPITVMQGTAVRHPPAGCSSTQPAPRRTPTRDNTSDLSPASEVSPSLFI